MSFFLLLNTDREVRKNVRDLQHLSSFSVFAFFTLYHESKCLLRLSAPNVVLCSTEENKSNTVLKQYGMMTVFPL